MQKQTIAVNQNGVNPDFPILILELDQSDPRICNLQITFEKQRPIALNHSSQRSVLAAFSPATLKSP